MLPQDISRRLSPQVLSQDTDALNGFKTIEVYGSHVISNNK